MGRPGYRGCIMGWLDEFIEEDIEMQDCESYQEWQWLINFKHLKKKYPELKEIYDEKSWELELAESEERGRPPKIWSLK